jgi:hypothetical protein
MSVTSICYCEADTSWLMPSVVRVRSPVIPACSVTAGLVGQTCRLGGGRGHPAVWCSLQHCQSMPKRNGATRLSLAPRGTNGTSKRRCQSATPALTQCFIIDHPNPSQEDMKERW